MTNHINAMRLAFETLEKYQVYKQLGTIARENLDAAITALTAALVEPSAERDTCGSGAGCLYKDALIDHLTEQLAAFKQADK